MSRVVLKSIKNTIITLLIFGVLGLGFFLVLFGDSVLEQVRETIIDRIEQEIPFRFGWERMAIFPINNLVLEGVEVFTLEDEEPFFTAEKVVVAYSFWELVLGGPDPVGSIKRINIEKFAIWAEDPLALIPEIEEEDFRAHINITGGHGLVGWEGESEEVENISGQFWPEGERGWRGNLRFSLGRFPESPIDVSGYWEPGEWGGNLEVSDFPVNLVSDYLPQDQLEIREGRVSGKFHLEYGQELDYRGNFNIAGGQVWVASLEQNFREIYGEIEFSPSRLEIKDGRAFMEETQIDLAGYFLPAQEEFDLGLGLHNLDLSMVQSLMEKTGNWNSEYPDLSGRGDFSVEARGTTDDPSARGNFSLGNLQLGDLVFRDLEGFLSYEGETLWKQPNIELEFTAAGGQADGLVFSNLQGLLSFEGETFEEKPFVELDFSLEEGRYDQIEISGFKGHVLYSGETLVKKPYAEMEFSLAGGRYDQLEFSDLEGWLSYQDDLLGEDPFLEMEFALSRGLFDHLELSSLEGFLSFQDGILSLHHLEGDLAGGRFSLFGQAAPEVLMTLNFSSLDPSYWPEQYPWAEQLGKRGKIDGTIMLSGYFEDWQNISLAGDISWTDPVIMDMEMQDLEGIFWASGEEILFSPLLIRDKFGGMVEIQGTTDMDLQELNLQVLASGIKPEHYPLDENIYGEIDVDGRIVGSLEYPDFQGSFSARGLSWEEEKLGDVEGKIRATQNLIEFSQVSLVHQWGGAQARGSIDLSGERPHTDLYVEATGPCISPIIDRFDFPLELCGEVRLSMAVEGCFSEPAVTGNIELAEGVFNDQVFDFLRTGFGWKEESLTFSDLKINAAGGMLTGKGSWQPPGEMEIVIEGREIALGEVKEWEKQFPFARGDVSFTISAGGTWPELHGEGFLQIQNIFFEDEYIGEIEGDFAYEEGVLDLKNIVLSGQEGVYSIDGRAQVVPLGDLDLRLTTEEAPLDRLLSLAGWEDFWIPLVPVILSGELKLGGDFDRPHLEIGGSAIYPAGELKVTGGGYLEGPYEARIQGPVDLDLVAEFLPEEFEIQGRGTVEVFVHYDDSWKVSGTNMLEELAFNGVHFSQVGGVFSWEGDQPVFLEQRLQRENGEVLEIKGDVPLEPDRPDLNLHVYTDGFDLGFLAAFNPFLLSLGGRGQVDATMRGSMEEPFIEGNARVEGGYFTYFNLPGWVEEIEGGIEFKESEMVMQDVSGRYSEGGKLDLKGRIVFRGWEPDYYDLLLSAEELHINHGTIDGYGNGEMAITGSYFEPQMVGYLDVYDTVIGIPFDWPFEEVEEETPVDPHFELTFRPAGNIRVQDGNFDVQVQSGELVLDNRTDDMELVGEVFSRQGNMNFYNTSFRLVEGRARFLRFGESIPNISATAQTTVRDTQVFVHLDGPALDMDMRLVSQPPLEEQEIIDLLVYRGGLGDLLRGDLPGAFRQELWRIIGETFRTSFLVELQTTIGDFLELDEFLITPIFLGAEERIEFYVGKAITDRIYITYTQDFRTDGSSREFAIEYRLRDNLFLSGSLQDEGHFQLGIEYNYPF